MKDRSLTPTNKGVAGIPWGNLPHLNIPLTWFEHICFDDGKPHIQAMVVLADVVAWYQPRAIEDPETGLIARYERKFNGEQLQAYSGYFEEKFGMSEKQFRGAKDRLVAMGVVQFYVVEKLAIATEDGSIAYKYNVPFIDLNLPILYKITLPKEWQMDGGGMPCRTQGYALQGTGVCPTGHTTDITYTEYLSSSLTEQANGTVSNDEFPPDPFIGKTLSDYVNQRQSVIDAKARKVLVESLGLTLPQFHANTDRLAEIHGKVTAIWQMNSDNDLKKMQEMTNKLALVKIDTVEKINALYENWEEFSSLGKKTKKAGTVPIGSNLTDHASFLRDKGFLDDNGNITATMGIKNTNGGSECGDGIDYNQAVEDDSDMPEVQPGLLA